VICSYAAWRWRKSGLQVLTLREQRFRLNRNALDLVEAHLVVPAIVELGGAGRGVVRHGGGVFERAIILQIRRDAGRRESVIADRS
jgi:hypothetical protein